MTKAIAIALFYPTGLREDMRAMLPTLHTVALDLVGCMSVVAYDCTELDTVHRSYGSQRVADVCKQLYEVVSPHSLSEQFGLSALLMHLHHLEGTPADPVIAMLQDGVYLKAVKNYWAFYPHLPLAQTPTLSNNLMHTIFL